MSIVTVGFYFKKLFLWFDEMYHCLIVCPHPLLITTIISGSMVLTKTIYCCWIGKVTFRLHYCVFFIVDDYQILVQSKYITAIVLSICAWRKIVVLLYVITVLFDKSVQLEYWVCILPQKHTLITSTTVLNVHHSSSCANLAYLFVDF